MKILITTPLYPPDIGGPATYAKFLEDSLPKDDFSVRILSFCEVRRLPYIIRHIVYFFKVLSQGKHSDIIYALDPLGVGVPAGLAAKLLRKRFFMRIAGDRAWETAVQKWNVGDSLDDFSRSKKYPLAIRLLKHGQTFGAKLAEKIIVPSEYLKTIVSNWGVSKEKVHVIYNAFEPVIVEEGKEAAREDLSLSGTVLLSAGRLVSWKGFKALIHLMPQIVDEVPDAVLYIAGDGPEKEKLFELSSDLRQREKVIFLGTLPKEKLLQYMQAADVFLLNTFYEGFSHQLLEAMSLGAPVVSTTVGGNPELLESEKEGLLVEYNDEEAIARAALRLLREEGLARRLALAARKKAETFSKERVLSEFAEFIKECST
ncbi:MAG: glycosyltransferase family 4 protein [Parcubacteria group bacterium]|nr:glycosyltransferase family 4 protein [Parcubacteria group bacterium]